MARTKDRWKEHEQKKTSDKIYRAAIYVRLSQERKESWREKSCSIESQQIVCKNYADEENIKVVETYIDYEKSGTNFDRDGYKRMMDDVRNRKVDCIIVRDLSRLGREHIEMGRLIDKVFPFLGVRFISVNDNLDTLKGVDGNKSFEVVLKNIVNDMYAKDASVKIKSTKMNKAQNGYFIGSVPPYGYKVEKTPEGQILVVDESVRTIVENMFEWTLEGLSQRLVAERLNKMNIVPPMVHYRTGRVYREEGDSEWTASSVGKILVNEKQYGAMIQGKRSQYLAKGQKQTIQKNEDWIVVENTHEGIVSKEMFEKVQRLRKERKANHVFSYKEHDVKRERVNRFEGLVFRKGTDEKLYRRYRYVSGTRQKGKPEIEYIFINKRHNGEIRNQTENIVIRESLIDEAIYLFISKSIKKMEKQKELIERLSVTKDNLKKTADTEIKKLNRRINWQKNWQRKLYEKYVFGELTRDEYLNKKEESKSKVEIFSDEIARYENQKSQIDFNDKRIRKWIKDLYKAEGKKKLSKELIHSLVEKIEIGEDQSVVISFKFNTKTLGGALDE